MWPLAGGWRRQVELLVEREKERESERARERESERVRPIRVEPET